MEKYEVESWKEGGGGVGEGDVGGVWIQNLVEYHVTLD